MRPQSRRQFLTGASAMATAAALAPADGRYASAAERDRALAAAAGRADRSRAQRWNGSRRPAAARTSG